MRPIAAILILLLVSCQNEKNSDSGISREDSVDIRATVDRYFTNYYIKQDFFEAVYDIHPDLNRDTIYRKEVKSIYKYTLSNPFFKTLSEKTSFHPELLNTKKDTALFKVTLKELNVGKLYSDFLEIEKSKNQKRQNFASLANDLVTYINTSDSLPYVTSEHLVMLLKYRDLFYIRSIKSDSLLQN